MRIGVNALYLIPGGVGGTEIYLRNLLRGLAEVDKENEYFIFTNRETGSDLVPEAANFHWRPLPVKAVFRPFRLIYEQTGLPRAAAAHKIDCLLNAGFTAPLALPCPNVTVFHDLQHKRHPENFRWFDLPFWDFFLWSAVRRSKLLIAVSGETKRDLQRFYKLPDARIRIVPHGVEREFFEIARNRAPEKFLLCVSTLHPHKNLERLIRVFSRFQQRVPGYRLVLTGMRGFHTEAIERLIAELKLGEEVRLTGWIERAQLYDLYRRAAAFIYPSTFEGFGMPVLEAMAAEVPLACSNIEPLQSLADGAAVLFAPEDEEGMLAALEEVIQMPARGHEQAAAFTWETAARKTLAALREAVGPA